MRGMEPSSIPVVPAAARAPGAPARGAPAPGAHADAVPAVQAPPTTGAPTAIAAPSAVRAVRVALAGDVPAAHAGLLMRDDTRPFALVGRWAGAAALAGGEPVRIADADREDPFALLDEQPPLEDEIPDGFVGGGWFGVLSYGLGRRLETLGAPPPAPAGERLPATTLAFYDHLLRCDGDGQWWFEALWSDARAEALEGRLAELTARVAAGTGGERGPQPLASGPADATRAARGSQPLASRPADATSAARGPQPLASRPADAASTTRGSQPLASRPADATSATRGPRPFSSSPWRASPSPAGHAGAVQACRERIAAGDLFQANLSLRLSASVEGDPVDLFTRGVEALAPDRGAWLAGPWGAVASLSPELFVARSGDVVRTAPIKGTRPRPADAGAAETARTALAASAKDRAENVMIVDLMRNDLGRVSEPGTIEVTALAEVRPHAGVWHLVSEVRGRLRQDVGDGALVAALFPPGSVTGAPKLAAMDVISTLESTARQAFCGAIGFASPAAGLELSVAIRTFECRDGHAWLDVGGGIVADSDPAAEAAEALAKAHPLLAAIGGTLEETAAADTFASADAAREDDATEPADDDSLRRDAAPRPLVPPRLGAHPVGRPDPVGGVLETILVRDGVAIAMEAHLARLADAAAVLYDVALPSALAPLVAHTALEQGGPCRLRVLLDPTGEIALQVAPLPAAGDGTQRLVPLVVPGGLGDRKWRDRRLIDALDDHADEAAAVPLLVDLDGRVLETTRANVLAWIGGTLVTPPLDGRILPGVTRARALAWATELGIAVAERPLDLAEIGDADAVLTTGALRGLQPVTAIADQPVPAPDDRMRTLMARFTPLR
jgi:para-aminobenzoate synthetase/4-amino-4-deoxychorismate lyase